MNEGDPTDPGVAGASARREHERRRQRREALTRDRHRVIGKFLVTVRKPPSHEEVWAQGAKGEELVGGQLADRLGPSALLLHDRRVPRSRANIDHIAVAASGVWVIDAKRYKGRAEVKRPLFGRETLLIGGRDRSKLGEGLQRQVSVVRGVVDELVPGAPVHGALCFTLTDLPLLRNLTFMGFPLAYPKALSKRIAKPGPLNAEAVAALHRCLAERLGPA